MNKALIFILILSLATLIYGADSTNDIESPLIVNELDPRSQHYNQLQTNDDSDDDTVTNPPEDRSWTIPNAQFAVGLPIFGTIFGFLTSFEENDPISLFMRAIYVMSFLVCVQVYFGFYLSCQRRQNSYCPLIPEIVYTEIDFGHGPMDVSFGRWISGPFTWISEIFSFLPDEAYAKLEETGYFPPRSITHMIFMVQLFYYIGIYDCYRNNIMSQI